MNQQAIAIENKKAKITRLPDQQIENFMVTRLVKMHFLPAEAERFLAVFEEVKERIAGFEGCLRLELQRDVQRPEVFFTVSRWRSEEDLEIYRKSELFQGTWARTKVLFAERAEAWTVQGVFDSGI